jgi:zona occludens toxin (predicted ATPase)
MIWNGRKIMVLLPMFFIIASFGKQSATLFCLRAYGCNDAGLTVTSSTLHLSQTERVSNAVAVDTITTTSAQVCSLLANAVSTGLVGIQAQ